MTDHHTSKHHASVLSLTYKWLLDPDYKRGFNHTLERSIAFLIVASVIAVLIENTPEIYNSYAGLFHWFDVFTVGIFTAEYVLRVATAHLHPDYAGKSFPRLRYALSFYALIDLIAIAPFYFARFVDVDSFELGLRRRKGCSIRYQLIAVAIAVSAMRMRKSSTFPVRSLLR